MISYNRIPYVQDLLSYILFAGFASRYSAETIQEKLLNSSFVYFLENNKEKHFLNNIDENNLLVQIYEVVEPVSFYSVNAICRWSANMYIDLFYKYHKSFSYLFLIIPLKDMIVLFDIYHEMDESQLFDLYQKREKELRLLPRLLKEKRKSIRELSILTGISENTLTYYSRDNKNIYNASFANIVLLAGALDVDENIFKEKINNYIDYSSYSFNQEDIKYRSFLALFIIQYYFPEFVVAKYQYDDKSNILKSDINVFKTFFLNSESGYVIESEKENPLLKSLMNKIAAEVDDKNTNIMMFEYNQISNNLDTFTFLREYGYKNIFIINTRFIFRINDAHIHMREIDTLLYDSVSKRAIELSNYSL